MDFRIFGIRKLSKQYSEPKCQTALPVGLFQEYASLYGILPLTRTLFDPTIFS